MWMEIAIKFEFDANLDFQPTMYNLFLSFALNFPEMYNYL